MTIATRDAPPHPSQAAFDRFAAAVEWPVAVLALAVVPALLLETRSTAPALVRAAVVVNWLVWIGFCAEYLVKLYLAPVRLDFVRRAWFDLLIILFSPPFLVPESWQAARGLRAARAVRLLRLLRAFAVAGIGLRLLRSLLRHRRFEYVLAVAVGTVALGALGIFAVEGGTEGHIQSFGDALWWAAVTATTVGYGDISPATTEGRLIAVALMITGIGVIGMFTATVASLFFGQDAESDTARLEYRLARLEEKLDAVLRELSRTRRE